MRNSGFGTLEEVIHDEHFPGADLALRRGRHIGSDDGSVYEYLIDALDHLEPFYRRFGADLIQRSDGYFYLLPSGERLGRRHVSRGEMLVGQVLALIYLDPAALKHGGLIQKDTLLQRLSGLFGAEMLLKTLNPRKRKRFSERVARESVRLEVAKSLRRLVDLGFVDLVESGQLRLRPALMRFAEPARVSGESQDILERLILSGEVVLGDVDEEAEEHRSSEEDEVAE